MKTGQYNIKIALNGEPNAVAPLSKEEVRDIVKDALGGLKGFPLDIISVEVV